MFVGWQQSTRPMWILFSSHKAEHGKIRFHTEMFSDTTKNVHLQILNFFFLSWPNQCSVPTETLKTGFFILMLILPLEIFWYRNCYCNFFFFFNFTLEVHPRHSIQERQMSPPIIRQCYSTYATNKAPWNPLNASLLWSWNHYHCLRH